MEKLNLEIGDIVVVKGNRGQEISKVTMITPLGKYEVNGELYDEYGLYKGASKWTNNRIRKATKEEIVSIHQKNYIKYTKKRLKEIRNITYKQALEINAFLENLERIGE